MRRRPKLLARSRALRWRLALVLFCFASLSLVSRAALAYPWMIQHSYPQCQGCHVDPAGAGVLTSYGRAMSEVLLTMPLGEKSDDPTPAAGFLWGAVDVPEPLHLGGDLRILRLAQKVSRVPLRTELIYMQLDLEAAITLDRFVASGSLGYLPEGGLGAALTRGDEHNVVSRQHWVGYRVRPDSVLLRAGRMNLPFGIRNVEHTLWSRALTRTNINDQQQYGLAVSVETPVARGEAMAILGNLQLRPDDFRERGYSAYIEVPVLDKLALGASSLVTHRQLDARLLSKTYRQAHGIFGRWGTPYPPLAILTEWNYLLESPEGGRWRNGVVGHLQADFEATQGVHFMITGEAHNVGVQDNTPLSWSAWLSYAWFFAAHVDLRIDGIYQRFGSSSGPDTDVLLLLAQAHVSL